MNRLSKDREGALKLIRLSYLNCMLNSNDNSNCNNNNKNNDDDDDNNNNRNNMQ